MNYKYNYWYFSGALSDKVCDDIIKLGKSKKLELGITGTQSRLLKKNSAKELSKKEIKDLKKTRDSNIVFMNEQWLYDLIMPYVFNANVSSGWNFETSWNESFQFTSYKKNQHYTWHQDSWNEVYKSENINFNNKMRKLSVICSLTDPKEYKGGDLQFWISDPNVKKPKPFVCKEIKKRGSIIVFPSYVWHRVTPVTKGHRHSLVMWSLGPAYK